MTRAPHETSFPTSGDEGLKYLSLAIMLNHDIELLGVGGPHVLMAMLYDNSDYSD